ncbi:hypothetical protein EBU24_06510, partial [bacterium]|nr:hypothetical protein [bacterium]
MKKLLLINLFILQSFGLMASDLPKENNNDWQTYNNNNLNPKPSRLDALLAVLPIFIEQNNNDQLQSNQESSHTPLIQKNTQEDRSSLKRKHKNDDCDSDDCDDNYTTKRKPMIDGIELTAHINIKHKGLTYSCKEPGCDKTYQDHNGLSYHTKTRHQTEKIATEKKTYACTEIGCNKIYNSTLGLFKHINSYCYTTSLKLKSRRNLCDTAGNFMNLNEILNDNSNKVKM